MPASKYHRASGLLSAPADDMGRDQTADDALEEGIEDAEAEVLEQIPDKKDYLDHANQCGYLLKNVTLNFLKSKRMHGTSVKTRIKDLVPHQLRDFTGANGEATLAALSTHEDTKLEKSDRETKIYSGWSGFARAVIAFLNVDVDVDAISARHRASGGDSIYRPLNKWGVGRKAVIERLVSQRPDIDAEKIQEAFTKGFGGGLSIGGRPAIKVRF